MASSSYLKSQRRIKINERDTYIRRQQGVDNIIGNINTDLDVYISNTNCMISSCSSWLSSGLKGKKGNISEEIQDEQEKYPYSDSKISSSNSKLSEESKRCQNKITLLNSEISSLDSQIREAEQREAEERRRAMEEYMASLKGSGKK